MVVFASSSRDSTTQSEPGPAYAELSGVLWQQRENMETLLFRLVAEQSVVSDGRLRWLHCADEDVCRAVEALRLCEVNRAMVVDQIADAIGLDHDVSLAAIAEHAPQPWQTLLHGHRTALRELALEVQGMAAQNRRLLDAGARAVGQALDHLAASVCTYDSAGGPAAQPHLSLLLDEQA